MVGCMKKMSYIFILMMYGWEEKKDTFIFIFTHITHTCIHYHLTFTMLTSLLKLGGIYKIVPTSMYKEQIIFFTNIRFC